MAPRTGCVFLVGAGCGSSDLITRRGWQLLQTCDTVVYDDLIAADLPAAAPPKAERIYVGKRCGRHSALQKRISALLVEKARQGRRVVRLKGGDPFVFGRGGEEILALQEAGIPYEEVPGICSAIAIPAAAGIPVTHRGQSQSFHVITGHTADSADGLPDSMDTLARLPGTLVFLMGLHNLPKIVSRLTAAGKTPTTPAAVVSGGNAPFPAAVRGTLDNIVQKTQKAGVQAPAIIVVGAVAAMDLSPTIFRPLRGVRVGVTGTPAFSQKLSALLREQGAAAVSMGSAVCEALPLSFLLSSLADGSCHWIVLTSANGVHFFWEQMKLQNLDIRQLSFCKFAVIGAATGTALRQYGISADLCPAEYSSRALAQALCDTVKPEEDIFLFRSADGAAILPQMLRDHSLVCREFPLYRLVSQSGEPSFSVPLQYLTFASASGVQFFLNTHQKIPLHTTCVCIGDSTGAALRQFGVSAFLTAEKATAESMVQAICKDRAQKQPR
ncbi:MAG: uroporphyrinogen-III C-methyltransferase [Oscillospiraceae bacterium]|jgi:uroporphyrinogen III methyltransferase/synthase|nr:uroporphyrinogen-III C-methyltransferase [Oscillospiraceae bacterium]MDD3260609.1 uroporphyrinogen-III C-methyltransferase [Oscillospiraceae bacterium]